MKPKYLPRQDLIGWYKYYMDKFLHPRNRKPRKKPKKIAHICNYYKHKNHLSLWVEVQ